MIHKISAIVIKLLFLFCLLSVLSAKEVEPVIKVVTDMQDRYNAMPETLPVICMLSAAGTSAITAKELADLETQLVRQMITQGLVKPVLMDKYLSKTFLKAKTASPFAFLRALAEERYTVPLQGICKPYIFKNESTYVIRLAFYHLKGGGYPVEIIRMMPEISSLSEVIDSCLEEFALRYFDKEPAGGKKILIKEFFLEFRKLVELSSGEFEFVSSPFIQQSDFTLKEGDDYFSLFFSHILSSTGMFKTLHLGDFKEYSQTNISVHSNADYVIQGRVQLTDQLSFLYVDLYEARRGSKIVTIKHPLRGFTLPDLISAYREIAYLLAKKIFPENSFDLLPDLSDPGNAFYYQNRLIGWDTLEYFFLPKGMHKIDVGSYLNSHVSIKSYFILHDIRQHIFMDREGTYAWNLLQK